MCDWQYFGPAKMSLMGSSAAGSRARFSLTGRSGTLHMYLAGDIGTVVIAEWPKGFNSSLKKFVCQLPGYSFHTCLLNKWLLVHNLA